jgi:hypothetical protein
MWATKGFIWNNASKGVMPSNVVPILLSTYIITFIASLQNWMWMLFACNSTHETLKNSPWKLYKGLPVSCYLTHHISSFLLYLHLHMHIFEPNVPFFYTCGRKSFFLLFNLLTLCLLPLISLAFNEATYIVTFLTFPFNLFFNLVFCWNNWHVRFSKVLEAFGVLSHVDMTLLYLASKLLMILATMALALKILFHLLAN